MRIRITDKTLEYLEMLGSKKMSLNKALFVAMRRTDLKFGPQYLSVVSDSKNNPKTTTVDAEVKSFIDGVRSDYEILYGKRIKLMQVVEIILRAMVMPEREGSVSVNVKGYKSKPSEFKKRLVRIADEIKVKKPKIVFVQEFVAGEDMKNVEAFRDKLGNYSCIMPEGFDADEHYGFCVCAAFVRNDLYHDVRVMRMRDMKGTDCELRYNYFSLGDKRYLNCWMPQIVKADRNRAEQGKKMWENVLTEIRANEKAKNEFYLVGDLNSYVQGGLGSYEDEISEAERLLWDTKSEGSRGRATNRMHELDRAFVNRSAMAGEKIETTLFSPSFIKLGLSDHEALFLKYYN